jgi:hypothetical protein
MKARKKFYILAPISFVSHDFGPNEPATFHVACVCRHLQYVFQAHSLSWQPKMLHPSQTKCLNIADRNVGLFSLGGRLRLLRHPYSMYLCRAA